MAITDPTEPPTPPAPAPSYLFLGVLTVLIAALDLGTKHWATKKLGGTAAPALIKVVEHLNFNLAHNKGGAGSFLSTTPDAFRLPFFLGVSCVAIVAMVLFYRKLQPHQWALRWALPLMLGGAIGNFVDRVRLGVVVDFIQVYATIGGQVRYWPTFNVADIAICVGVGLMAVDLVQQTRASLKAPAPHDQPTAS
ncbi:MAG: signal peptidase II [Polyangiaceae bacterium]|jgi:signal peptidase II|nr:signal peptidase II [Polyangiaceae bacterium]